MSLVEWLEIFYLFLDRKLKKKSFVLSILLYYIKTNVVLNNIFIWLFLELLIKSVAYALINEIIRLAYLLFHIYISKCKFYINYINLCFKFVNILDDIVITIKY